MAVIGLRSAMVKARAWGDAKHRGLEEIITKYTLLIEGEAKGRAPVDTGKLRASIHHELESLAGFIIRGKIKSGVGYAIHQEFGTRYQSGTPHMRPAFDKYVNAFIREVENFLAR